MNWANKINRWFRFNASLPVSIGILQIIKININNKISNSHNKYLNLVVTDKVREILLSLFSCC